ncbi:hypothetical protein QQF64_016059 [Cirrhinus molitorella]|uniref:Uncharacterized protein n=2 Tax=Cirrhinus molitorella TaxID=172907 RepID=A0AA88PIV9_9TELE|nr:hypothetical protein Q8A67_017739 [Cirrhinus molitorella]
MQPPAGVQGAPCEERRNGEQEREKIRSQSEKERPRLGPGHTAPPSQGRTSHDPNWASQSTTTTHLC